MHGDGHPPSCTIAPTRGTCGRFGLLLGRATVVVDAGGRQRPGRGGRNRWPSRRSRRTYQARVELLLGPYNTDTDTLGAAGRLAQTYAELVTTEPLLGSAIAETRADVSVSALQARTRAIANDATRILAIEVQDTDPERARDLANALGDEIAQLASL